MRNAVTARAGPARAEQIILFKVSGQTFAVSSASVQEVRSADSMAGTTEEINAPAVEKVRQVAQRGDQSLFLVNSAAHFGLAPSPGALIFVLRKTRTALLVDGIEKMTSMTRLQALPQTFCHEERLWYRGLTAIDQAIVPVVDPQGFLTAEELRLLDAATKAGDTSKERLEEAEETQ